MFIFNVSQNFTKAPYEKEIRNIFNYNTDNSCNWVFGLFV